MGFLSDIFDPGREDREAGQAQADAGVITGTNTSGPGGITAGTSTADGSTTTDLGLGSFDPLLGGLQGVAQGGIEQAGAGFGDFAQQGDFQGLGDIFQSSLGTAQADPFDLGADISDRLRALSERRNQRSTDRLLSRLQGKGTGSSASGILGKSEQARGLREQGLQFDLAGLKAGQSLQKDAFGRALGSSQGRGNIFSSFLQNQAQGANIAFGGTQAASGLAQLPLSFLQAGGAEATRASNSRFGAAGVNLQAGAQAQSPFLEALNAAGGIAESFNINA